MAYIIDKSRIRDKVNVREICYDMLRTHTMGTLKEIAQKFGKKCHSTVINGLENHANFMQTEANYRELDTKIRTLFLQHLKQYTDYENKN